MIGYIVGGAAALLLVWMGGSYMSVHDVKEPPYQVEKVGKGYEIRRYEPYLVAEATPPNDSLDPLTDGFKMLFAYITGANTGSRKIPMTAPVLQETRLPEKIPMSIPVLNEQRERPVVIFVLPSDYTLDTAPLPTDERIRLAMVPERRVAVLRFSGFPTSHAMHEKQQELRQLLARDGLKGKRFIEAYYDPPWTPPFMRRNEVMAELPAEDRSQ